ncbi:hypothetical protein [Streptomyces sp. NPDC004042]|uniref:hypothetical protein n=1 Tax=Streptomyces sp. NPDC004042 TaxID=3154451 RepID=UPI0033A24C91
MIKLLIDHRGTGMTHGSDGARPPVPPRPSQPPQPPPPVPPAGHGAPRWAWWVVGILIPVAGLVVTVATQQRPGSPPSVAAPSSGDAVVPGSPVITPAATSGAPDAPSEADAASSPDGEAGADADAGADTGSPSPTPSGTPAAAVLRTGDLSLESGDSADLEHGTTGKSVRAPDIAWSGSDDFSVLSGRITAATGGVTPARCVHNLRSYTNGSGWMSQDGEWFCLPTSAGHVAALEYLGRDEGRRRFHYIVWDLAAPAE